MNHIRSSFVAGLVLLVMCLWWSMSGADWLDWIFADSFESGDASAWSWSDGPYAVIPDAASEGAFGLRVPAIPDESAWVQDENPWHETVVRTDFDLNADNLLMEDGDAFALYVGWVVEDTTAAFMLSLEQVAGQTSLRLAALEDPGGTVTSPAVPLPGPGWHRIGLEYGAGTGSSDRGEMRLFIDGVLEIEMVDLDNDGVLVESLRLGVVGGVDAGTSGSLDLDVYTSVRLFDPWPCNQSSSSDPSDSSSVCLDGEGRSTAVAVGGCGDGVVVWRGSEDLGTARSRLGGIYGKKVSGTGSRTGEPFLIVQDENATVPDIGMDAVCRSFVVWRTAVTGEAIFAGVFDLDGTPLATQVLVAAGGDAEEWPAVAVSASGRFLVAWRRTLGPEQSIWGRFFEDDATPLGPEFQIDSGGGVVSAPAATMNGDGFALVAWESSGVIFGQRFDDDGNPLGLVSLSAGPNDGEPSVGMVSDGGFVAVWTRSDTDIRVYMRHFDPTGAPVAGEIRVDTPTPADCAEPQVAVGPADGFAVVWSSVFEGVSSIRGQSFAGDGDPDEEFEMETEGEVWFPVRPRIAVAGRLLVSFSELAEFYLYARGALIGARTPGRIFADGFESGDMSAWSTAVP